MAVNIHFALRHFGMWEASIKENRLDQSFDGALAMAMAPTQCTEDITVVPLVLVVHCSAHHDCFGDDSRHYQVRALSLLALRRIRRQLISTASAQERWYLNRLELFL
jgi:hypothetical protein